jgi:hypothetical protein
MSGEALSVCKQPQKVGPWSAFVGELLTLATAGTIAVKHSATHRGNRVVANAGEIWRSMTLAQQSVFEQKAMALRQERVQQLEGDMAALVQEIRDRKVALERARRLADDVPGRFTACRLSEKDRIDFKSAEGKRFFQGHGLPLSATFSMHRHGEHTCGVFGRYWVARVGFLMDLATGQAAGAGFFSEASMATFCGAGRVRTSRCDGERTCLAASRGVASTPAEVNGETKQQEQTHTRTRAEDAVCPS